MKAIDVLKNAGEDFEEIEKAVRVHMECPSCKGGGGSTYYPEMPCNFCGFTYEDSFNSEHIIAMIEALDDAKKV